MKRLLLALLLLPCVAVAQTAVTLPTPPTFCTGQVLIAVTGAAVQLTACALVNGVTLRALTTNAGNVTVGSSSGLTSASAGTGNGDILAPGEKWSAAVPNVSAIWINGTAGYGVSWTGN